MVFKNYILTFENIAILTIQRNAFRAIQQKKLRMLNGND